MIRLDNVSKYYRSQDNVSVGMKRINLEFDLGEFVAVTGESGSGKSTLLNVISGLDGYEEGELYLFGEETSHYTIADWEKYRSAYVGFVFQNYNIIDSYTVLQNVLLALEVQGYPKHERKKRALELIEQVGLLSHKHHKASRLSGGQKQRAVIARALAKDCPVIVADEPTGNLDSASAKQVMKLLHDISKDKLIVVVTHDYAQVEAYATRKIKMHDGEVTEDKRIKPSQEVATPSEPKKKRMPFLTLCRFALRNLLATPKKLVFVLLMQMLVIAVFTLVYSNQISNIREIGLEQSSAFPVVPETRVLVERRDGDAFSDDEIRAFESLRHVRSVYENGNNFHNQSHLTLQQKNGFGRSFVRATDTAESLSKRDIEGELPVAADEIVFSSSYGSFSVGDVVELSMGRTNYYGGGPQEQEAPVLGTFTITGIDDRERETIYFSEAYLNQEDLEFERIDYDKYENLYWTLQSNMRLEYEETEYYVWSAYGESLDSDVVIRGQGELEALGEQTVTFRTRSTFDEELTKTLDVTVSVAEIEDREASIDQEFYEGLLEDFIAEVPDEYAMTTRDLISLSVDGYYAGNRLIETIDYDDYKVYYPANISSPMREFLVFFAGLMAVILLTLFGLFLYSIVHAVTRNVMNARKKDFAIFRSIGTNQHVLARVVVLEQVIVSVTGFILTLIVLNLLSSSIPMIGTTIPYMERQDYVILFVVFVLFGTWLGLRFNRKVFKQSVIETLTMSREE
ncbi:MAG: ATP-binding cassette domain-containing protein [Acholeplasmataceae bacterium]